MNKLLECLRNDALKTGLNVTLASGQKSDYYVDSKQISLFGPSLKLIGDAFWEKLKELDSDVDAVAGVSLGGDPLASSVVLSAHSSGKDINAYLIRKESKGHGASEGDRVEGRKHLKNSLKSMWLLEDVVSTGGSSLSAAIHLKEMGYPLKGVLCILDRDMGGLDKLSTELGVPALALFSIRDVLEK